MISSDIISTLNILTPYTTPYIILNIGGIDVTIRQITPTNTSARWQPPTITIPKHAPIKKAYVREVKEIIEKEENDHE